MREKFSKYFKGDKIIWGVIVILSIASLLVVYSSTGTLAYKFQHGNTGFYLIRHFMFLLVGFAMIYFTHLIPYRYYSKLSQLFLFLVIPMLALTLVVGARLNEASRWLTIPGLGVTMQTSDFAKLALIMYIARILSIKQETIKQFKEGFLPLIIPVLVICALILPANFSTSAIVFVTSIIIMFIGRVNIKHILGLAFIGIAILTVFIVIVMNTNTRSRVGTWKARIEAYTGEGGDTYQSDQAKIAVVTGGILGKGPGKSTQRNFLPHPYSDFIYAIIVEEYGLIGGVIILFMYLYLLYRASFIVRNCTRTFPAFLSFGLALLLVFQAMINMGVSVNLLPVTGQTLPLVSMGGTSIFFTSISLGIILSVSRELELEKLKPKPVQKEEVEGLNEVDNQDEENDEDNN